MERGTTQPGIGNNESPALTAGNQPLSKPDKHFIYHSLLSMINAGVTRAYTLKPLRRKLFRIITRRHADPEKQNIQLIRYYFVSSLLESVFRNLEKGFISKRAFSRLIDILVHGTLLGEDYVQRQTRKTFKKEHGITPPSFISIALTDIKSRDETGNPAKLNTLPDNGLPYHYLKRLMNDACSRFGCRVAILTGGEPFLYRNNGKSIIDLFKEFGNVFFLVFTQGKPISRNIAEQLVSCGNVALALEPENYDVVDHLQPDYPEPVVFNYLREAGIPFGLVVSPDTRNVDHLLHEDFYDHYFGSAGVSFMWIDQSPLNDPDREAPEMHLSEEQRINLYRKWKELLKYKQYCVADLFNARILFDGDISYGRNGGYIHVDSRGNITPGMTIPYSVDNLYEMYKHHRELTSALFSDLMIEGRSNPSLPEDRVNREITPEYTDSHTYPGRNKSTRSFSSDVERRIWNYENKLFRQV